MCCLGPGRFLGSYASYMKLKYSLQCEIQVDMTIYVIIKK